ncbi:kinase [Aestuariibacter halophilus]|uniref:Kinase n=1 Tax=Fluctibacter halophilus TaxID=226011 RepID=A0ABS8G527_9ALTE|nr:kinase [Aestuariibacter halophilus]MCC2615543.1 kinase [Aestuariibacter halophilus]
MLNEFAEKNALDQSFIHTAQKWFIPLAEQIEVHHDSANGPLFVGVNGAQGSGKSTLTAFLSDYFSRRCGLSVANLSLDDFYLSRQQRAELARTVHPLLATRGVPGTHDTKSMADVLMALRDSTDVALPRFDKSMDDPVPRQQWSHCSHADIVLFEGWCWGVRPQTANALLQPVNALEAEEDPNGVWRRYVNQVLATDYVPLYAHMDHWVMLKAPSFACIYQWRLEQEHKLAARMGSDAPGIMSAEQVKRFIQHYQRLTEHGLATLPFHCDWVYSLNTHRHINSCHQRGKD